jgi:hypothetical protein
MDRHTAGVGSSAYCRQPLGISGPSTSSMFIRSFGTGSDDFALPARNDQHCRSARNTRVMCAIHRTHSHGRRAHRRTPHSTWSRQLCRGSLATETTRGENMNKSGGTNVVPGLSIAITRVMMVGSQRFFEIPWLVSPFVDSIQDNHSHE